jgi:hypothetical protein
MKCAAVVASWLKSWVSIAWRAGTEKKTINGLGLSPTDRKPGTESSGRLWHEVGGGQPYWWPEQASRLPPQQVGLSSTLHYRHADKMTLQSSSADYAYYYHNCSHYSIQLSCLISCSSQFERVHLRRDTDAAVLCYIRSRPLGYLSYHSTPVKELYADYQSIDQSVSHWISDEPQALYCKTNYNPEFSVMCLEELLKMQSPWTLWRSRGLHRAAFKIFSDIRNSFSNLKIWTLYVSEIRCLQMKGERVLGVASWKSGRCLPNCQSICSHCLQGQYHYNCFSN